MKTKKKMTVGRAALYIIVYIAALFWIFPVIWMPVSYTHLDVYKRQ